MIDEAKRSKIELHLSGMLTACRACRSCSYGSGVVKAGTSLEFQPYVPSNLNYSRIMVVGQNPGFYEVQEQQPFVGESGAIFDLELKANKISRLDFYITNTVKCYTQSNARPSVESVDACSGILLSEIAAIKPLLIVTLGELAFSFFCNKRYSECLGIVQDSTRLNLPYGPYKIFPIYHPSTRNISDLERYAEFKKQIKKLAIAVRTLKK